MEITKEQMVQYTIDYSYMEGRMGILAGSFHLACRRYIRRHGRLPTIANMRYFQKRILDLEKDRRQRAEQAAQRRQLEQLQQIQRKQRELEQLTAKVNCNIHKKLYAATK